MSLARGPLCGKKISPTPWQDAWRHLEKMYSDGTVGAIGVSNFSEDLIRELLGMCTVVPATVQNWMDPFRQDRAVRALCAEKGRHKKSSSSVIRPNLFPSPPSSRCANVPESDFFIGKSSLSSPPPFSCLYGKRAAVTITCSIQYTVVGYADLKNDNYSNHDVFSPPLPSPPPPPLNAVRSPHRFLSYPSLSIP